MAGRRKPGARGRDKQRLVWLVEEMEFFWCARCDAFVNSPTCDVKVPLEMVRSGGSYGSFQRAVWNMTEKARRLSG